MHQSSRNHNFIRKTTKFFTPEEETQLFIDWHAAKDSGNKRNAEALFSKIILNYTPIVRKWAKKMSGYNVEQEELLSEGLNALVDAANRFDLSLGNRFSTYAESWVRGVLFTYVSSNHFITNVCSNATNKKLFFSLRRYISIETSRNGSFELTPVVAQEIADKFDVPVQAIYDMNNIIGTPYESLNEIIGGSSDENNTTTKEDMLISTDQNAEDYMAEVTTREFHTELLKEAFLHLDDRERAILEAQSLRDKDDVKTLEELGNRFHISKERVRQIRNTAIQKLSKQINNRLIEYRIQPSDLFN